MNNIKVLSELKNCLIPLSTKEKEELEKSIVEYGCRDALILWGQILIDGHNRLEICQKHNIEYKTIQMDFKDIEEVKVWIIKNQLGRRNLNDAERIKIAKKIMENKSQEAKEKQLNNLKQNTANANVAHTDKTKKDELINVNKEIADIVDVSERTVARYNTIEKEAPKTVNKAVEENLISINRGYEITKQLKKVPESEKEEKGNKLIEQYINKEFKKIENKKAIELSYHNALFKILTLEIKEDEVHMWVDSMMSSNKERLESDIDEAIKKLNEIKKIYKNYNQIRRIK